MHLAGLLNALSKKGVSSQNMEFFREHNKGTSPAVVVGGVMRPGEVAEAETTLPAGECC